jgi:hypothetical protein
MTTKYDVGDIVLLPFVITEIHAYDKDDCSYEGYIKTDSEQPLGLPKEELDACAIMLELLSDDES